MRHMILNGVTIIFWICMLMLTFCSEDWHKKSLVHVQVGGVEKQYFPEEFVDESGEINAVMQRKLAISKKLYENGVFIIESFEKNGVERRRARKVDIVIGKEYEGYYEVEAGLSSKDQIVIDADRMLEDGGEVIVDE